MIKGTNTIVPPSAAADIHPTVSSFCEDPQKDKDENTSHAICPQTNMSGSHICFVAIHRRSAGRAERVQDRRVDERTEGWSSVAQRFTWCVKNSEK